MSARKRGREEAFTPRLVQQLFALHHPDLRVSSEALLAAGEFIRAFVLETRRLAVFEAECDEDTKKDAGDGRRRKRKRRRKGGSDSSSSGDDDDEGEDGDNVRDDGDRKFVVKERHIHEIACDLLIDF